MAVTASHEPVGTTDLGSKTLSGLAWTVATQVVRQGLQFVAFAVLAHLLTPSEFGVAAMIQVFSRFAILLSEMGLEAAIVQKRDLRESDLSTTFWLTLGFAVVVAAILCGLSRPIASLYGEPKVAGLVSVASLTVLFAAAGAVPRALSLRELRFRELGRVEMASAATAALTAIVIGRFVGGPVAVVAYTPVAAGCTTILLWRRSAWRPSRSIVRSSVRGVIRFGGNLCAFNVVNYWARNIDNVLVARYLGSFALGIYERAYMTVLIPVASIAGVAGRVMFPVLSKIQSDATRCRAQYLKAVSLIAMATFPMMLGLAVVAADFVYVAFGDKWADLVPLVRVFSLVGAVQSITTTVGWIYQSQGRTDLALRWGAFNAVLIVAAIVVGLALGDLRGVAMCYALVGGAVLAYPTLRVPLRLIGGTFPDVVRRISGVTACAVAMASSMYLVQVAAGGVDPVVRLALSSITGATVYAIMLQLFQPRPYRDFRAALNRKLSGGGDDVTV